MEHFNKALLRQSSLVSLVLLLTLFGFFPDKSRGLTGISVQSRAWMQLDKRVFQELQLKNRFDAIRQERRVKNRIHQVMREYNVRLDSHGMSQISSRIFSESRKYGHDPLLVTALIVTESSFNQRAKSHRGALGLMQVIPATGSALASEAQVAWKGNQSLYNPDTNIALGALYLNKMQERFQDLDLALEAYNHGPSKLSRYLRKGIQPRTYSKKVIEIYSRLRSKNT